MSDKIRKTSKIDYSEFDENYNDFISKTDYYQVHKHKNTCTICKLPKQILETVNKKLLSGENPDAVATYLYTHYPEMIKSRKDNFQKSVRRHVKYLPKLIDEVNIKSIFQRARKLIENKDIENMNPDEKAKLITEIELELCKEYNDVENERISMMNVLFKNIMPLMLERLQHEIVAGEARSVSDISKATEVMWKISSAMAATGIVEEKEEKEINFNELDETGNGKGTKKKILSLTDRISKAVDG